MDIRIYFRKLREIEAAIDEDFPIVISLETSDGGKPGIASEVSRFNAAKLIVEGRAVLAGQAEAAEHRNCQITARDAIKAADLARTVQIAIVDHSTLGQLKDKNSSPSSGSGK